MVISALWHESEYNFDLFWTANQMFGFPCCSTHGDLSIDVSITNEGLILTKIRWFQLFDTSHNAGKSKLNFKFKKKNQIFQFPCCNTHKDLSIDASITNVGLILTMPGWFFFSGYRHGFGILIRKHVSTQKNFELTAQN